MQTWLETLAKKGKTTGDRPALNQDRESHLDDVIAQLRMTGQAPIMLARIPHSISQAEHDACELRDGKRALGSLHAGEWDDGSLHIKQDLQASEI